MGKIIRLIIPTNNDILRAKFEKVCPYDEVEIYSMKNPPTTGTMDITLDEYHAWKEHCVNETIEIANQSKKEGFNALLTGSGSDPGVVEAKKVVKDFPIVGLGWANMYYATKNVSKFSIIMPGGDVFVEATRGMAKDYGFLENIVSLYNIKDYDPIFKGLGGEFTGQMKQIIKKCYISGAKGIVLACAFMSGVADELNEYSKKEFGIPVFNPMKVGVDVAKNM